MDADEGQDMSQVSGETLGDRPVSRSYAGCAWGSQQDCHKGKRPDGMCISAYFNFRSILVWEPEHKSLPNEMSYGVNSDSNSERIKQILCFGENYDGFIYQTAKMHAKRWHVRGKRWERKNRRQNLAKKSTPTNRAQFRVWELIKGGRQIHSCWGLLLFQDLENGKLWWEKVKSGPRLSSGVAMSMCHAADPALFLYDE